MKAKDISGITIRAFPVNAALIKGNFTMSYSDAKDLIKRTKAGIPVNKDFREWFLQKIEDGVSLIIEEKENKCIKP